MASRVSASEQELRALAGVVSEGRSDLPAQGLPLSLLSDLKDQIPCDFLSCHGYDTTLQQYWFTQQIPEEDGEEPSRQRLAPNLLGAVLGLSGLQLPRPHRRPAQHREGL